MSPARRSSLFRLTLLSALFAAVLGGKFLLIDRYGSDLPFWDQWDAEADNLIRPLQEGQLTVGHFLAAHNEHRIFFTRVLALGLFGANGAQWDARVEMVANALLHAGFAVLLALLALALLPRVGGWLYAGLLAWFCTAPSAWENTLGGFQSQFYFLLLFSALHLAGTLAAPPRSRAWWLAPVAGLAAQFSMASGVMSAAALAAILGLRLARDRRLSAPDTAMLAANAGLLILAGWLRVTVPNGLQVDGPGAWVAAAWHEFSWPSGRGWLAPLNLLPGLGLAWVWLRQRTEQRWTALLVAGCGWSALQVMALAYARGGFEHGYSSRYTDLLATAWLLNLLALFVLARDLPSALGRRSGLAAVVVFAAAGGAGLVGQNRMNQENFLNRMPRINQARLNAVQSYVATQDPSFFQKEPGFELPYPNADRLALLLAVPAIRSSLPASVRPGAVQPHWLSRLALASVHQGAGLLLLAAGLALTSAGLMLLPSPLPCPPSPNR